jgi:shikimate O-hydroxycinnamoyltransferase
MAKLRPALVQDTRIRGGVSAPRQILTGLDVFHGHIFVPVVLIYNKGFDIEQAQQGLSETLKQHPLVGGRLKRGKDGHTYVEGDDSGIVFRVYRCEGALPYGPHRPLGRDAKVFCKTFMPWQIVNRDMSVVLLELYRFECGGILMVCSSLHSFFDGASYSHFLNDWSKACLGQAFTPPASFDRSVMIRAGSEPHDASAYELMTKPPLLRQVGIVVRMIWRAATQMRSEVFRIPLPTIQKWKAQARAELQKDTGVNAGQLATAYIMQAISPVLPRGVERCVGLVLDLRFRHSLRLPRDYVGNALCWGEARYSEAELAQGSLSALADRCKPEAEQVSAGALIKLLALTEEHRQKKRLWRLMFKPVIQTLSAGLIQNNMSKLPIYDIDLGRGVPDWFDMAPMTIRMAVLVSTPEQDGGLDVHLTARRSEHQALRARLRADGIAA